VLTRGQALEGGLSPDAVFRLVRSSRWQPLQRGVYAVVPGAAFSGAPFSAAPTREAMLWAMLQRAGRDAVLSHQTAAELYRLSDRPSSLVHLTIPPDRHIATIPGTVIHRSGRVPISRHPSLLPPRTRIEETVLDLAGQATVFDDAFNWACAACQRRLTTADRLLTAMRLRKKMRWRAELTAGLAEIGDGAHSMLEYRYVRQVERPHRLPRADRQARVVRCGRSSYRDNLYADYLLCVELDGRSAHPDDRRWQDIHRDNAAAVDGLLTLRYNWADVTQHPCETALEIGAVLQQRGWAGALRRCGPACAIPR
jgi:very-short-patch-repair endonuclease